MQIYGDEEIIAKFVEEEQTEKRHREKSVSINGLDYHIERRELAAAGISLMLPIEFQQMPVDIAQQKYLSEQRPEVILTNPLYTVDFTVKPTSLQFNEQNILGHLKEIQAVRKKLHPETLFLEMKVLQLIEIQLGYVQFICCTIDGRALNTAIVLPHNAKLVLCMFTCDHEDSDLWRPIIHDMIHSIALIEGGTDNDTRKSTDR